ncbi:MULTISPECIES: GTP cyclohydrolase I [Frigoribacterium]|jgi:GTP cyclohydrolase I|uniref:GTP cyclohydrolase I n=1 Tax=Frigoribacterium TaxID=96492 RepID=UPI00070152D3|nr:MULTISPECIES: GTP cyclohydrolase I [Frigoribacterium]KQR47038.1 GTP cyclohydrolase I [Frigoribacterium sp. Leaf164]MBD8727874.1 GTP cyclohydrolase I [Frigoribacterium sp. CFBP 13707]NII50833.1 GTP cyclohydrolase I [Frigoribacterium endophyticum]QNE42812.1 GTP cyclohydrolase I [Frigoribacterium sp. NBH87]
MSHSPVDRPRIEAAVLEILAAVGDDPGRPGLHDTPRRVAEAYAEFFSGTGTDATELVRASSVPAEPGQLGEVVVVRDVQFRSVCEHHLLPFLGVAHVAYVPGASIVGLGSVPRVVDALASRPQLQEKLGEEIADAFDEGLSPTGVLVVLEAVHGCVTTRGPRQTQSSTVTLASRGSLGDAAARTEAMALIGAPRG